MSRAVAWGLWLVVVAVPVMFAFSGGIREGLRMVGAEMLGVALGLWYGSRR